MGHKAAKDNQTRYLISRENANLSRAAASEVLGFVSEDRIERIEYEKTDPYPEEILAMAEGYKNPELCNYYCSTKCPIGRKYVPKLEMKTLSQITLEILASLNAMEKEKNRLIEITVDGRISLEEAKDFKTIQSQLSEISVAIDSLQLWLEKAMADGKYES